MRAVSRAQCAALFALLLVVGSAAFVFAQQQLENEAGPARRGQGLKPAYGHKGTVAWRVPCDQVISQLDRNTTSQRGKGGADLKGGTDLTTLARQLNTTESWAEHCMRAYGRRPKRAGLEGAESREVQLEQWEGDEPEESAPEEMEDSGEREEAPEKPPKLPARTPAAGAVDRY
jgi:hypothetical protein